MIFLLATVAAARKKKMSSDDGKIDGAPEWVQEFLGRIDRRDAERNLQEDTAHKATLDAISDMSETVGQIAGSLARLEKQVDMQRNELRNTRDKMTALQNELATVHEKIDGLTERVEVLEGDLQQLRESPDGQAAPTEA